MASASASFPGAAQTIKLVTDALTQTAERRAHVDSPAQHHAGDNPWTDQIARTLRDLAAAHPALAADPRRHEIAAHWRFPALLEPGPVRAGASPLYDIAWRVHAADASRMIDQPLAAECVWRGGWQMMSRACDRLAQARCGVRLLAGFADPSREIGPMTLAEACAFRIAAFAPRGETVLLAFYGAAGGWRDWPGFTLFEYKTGARTVAPPSIASR